jgi:chorismate mutase
VVVYFIGNDKENEEHFELLRGMILKNTEQLISAYRERMHLADKLSEVKRGSGKPVRDRAREILVNNLIQPQNELESAFLNMIFESTIMAQINRNEPFPGLNMDRFCIKGNRESLLFITSRISCRPGDELYFVGQEERVFTEAASLSGAHVISERVENYDFYVNLKSFHGTEDIGFIDSDSLSISSKILTRNKVCAKILVES